MSTELLLPERSRQLEHPHMRHIDVQTLEALLRIEELLKELVELNTTKPVSKVTVEHTADGDNVSGPKSYPKRKLGTR